MGITSHFWNIVIANLASSHRTCLPCNPISLAAERIYHRLQPATFPTCSSPRLLPLRNPDRASAKPSSAHTQLRAHTQIATTHPYQRSKMSSAQANIQNYLGQLDKELSKYPTLNNLEKQAGVPKAYAVLGLGALYFFLIIFNLGGQLLTNFAGFVIPGYYSMAALFSPGSSDDTQWLTYWVVFAFFTVLESFVNSSTGSPSTSSSSSSSSCGWRSLPSTVLKSSSARSLPPPWAATSSLDPLLRTFDPRPRTLLRTSKDLNLDPADRPMIQCFSPMVLSCANQ